MDQNRDKETIYYVSSEAGSLGKALKDIADKSSENKDIKIVLKAGEYYLEEPVRFWKNKCKVTFTAEGNVRLIGGKRLSGFKKITDKNILSRFDRSISNKILQCDLSENGVKETSGFVSRGFGRPVSPSHTELFVDSVPYNIAQYPKRGKYTNITGFLVNEVNEWRENIGSLKGGFRYNSKQPEKWKKGEDIWVHGYWSWDWANSYEKVAELDVGEMTVKTAPPYGNYAFKTGQRFYFLNIMEEVTEPGDFFIDKKTNMLYFYPYEDSRCEEAIISMMDEPLIDISCSENIDVDGLSFEASRGIALRITDSENISVKNCLFKNIGNYAVGITGCKNILVTGCTIRDMGDGGVSVVSGDRKTLTPADISIHNNHIYNIAKWSRCYQSAVNISGIGISATHNLIHDCPHTAILYWGNDITIENNEIYSVVLDTGDAGAIYTGRDYSFRGNKVCRNYIHHLGGVGVGTMGIYNDDCVSGTLMQDNFFLEVSRAAYMGGGRDFLVKNNVFVNCYPSAEIDGRGASSDINWINMVNITMRNSFYDVGGDTALFTDRYPGLKDIDNFFKHNKKIPPSAVVENNIYCSDRKLELAWDSEKGEFLLRNNFSCGKDDFVDYKYSDLRIRPDSEALDYGYVNVDFHTIGLIEDQRKDNPSKVLSSLEIDMVTNTLLLYLKNTRGSKVRGRIYFYTDRTDDGLNGTYLEISLSAYEVKQYETKLPENYKGRQIEARSDAAGIRPCRAVCGGKDKI